MKALTKATAELLAPMKFDEGDRLEVSINKELTYFQLKVKSDGPWGPSLNASRAWWARFPERKEVKGFTAIWEVAATDISCEIIKALWPEDKMIFDADAKQVFDYWIATSAQLGINAEIYANFKESGQLPALAATLEVSDELPLAPYQRCAAALSMGTEGYGEFMEQGTGKTPTIISTICTEAKRVFSTESRMHRTIVVAPNNVRMNWQTEVARFTTLCGKVTVMRGGEVNRVKLFLDAITPEDDCAFTIIVMSYETLSRMWDVIEASGIEWDLAVLDESHYIKWPETARFAYAMKLRDRSKRRVVLTGTPVCNTPLDLYAQFEFMGKGFSGFHSWKAFRTFYGVFAEVDSDGEGSYKKLVGCQNLAFMKERLARLSFIVRKSEALPDLPDKVYDIIECEMTSKQAEAYKQIAEQLAIEIEDELDSSDNKAMTINNVLTKLLRLAQVTSGFVTWDAEQLAIENFEAVEVAPKKKKVVEFFEKVPKLDQLIETLKEKSPDDKTIVWACWVPDIKAISARLEAEGIKHVTFYGGTSEANRALAEEAFNKDPDVKVWISNPAAGGTGLNLLGYDKTCPDQYTTNVTHVIYYSQNWSMTQRAQSEDRAHRRGTRVQVRVSDLCVPETIDEEIRTRVLQKQKTALEVADIREILNNVLRGIVA